MPPHLLLVDDDTLLRRSLAFSLEQNGYRVSTAASAEDGLALAEQSRPDLVLLDIGLPGMDGLQALRRFQDQLHIPVIFLTARRRDLDEILGLELGAEDYLTKPFNNDVLLAHIKAVLRRVNADSSPGGRTVISAGDITVDPVAHRVTLAGAAIELTPREFELLYALVQNAGKVLSVDDLLARVWGAEFSGQPQVVYVHIRWLREKLEADPQNPCRIITVRGVGYKLEQQPKC
jgi:DNA-binding response OmpR family regulator